VRLVPSSTFSFAELAELFTAGYEEYFVPVSVDEAAFAFIVESWDIDLDRSRVAVDDSGPIGFANLGVRGERGWIGGLGVRVAARRSGAGRALMEAVLDVAPPVVGLEVIEQNEPAIALYRSLGFEETRVLEVWSLTEQAPEVDDVRVVDPRPLGQDDLPWQRQARSLPDGFERLETDGGAALVRTNGPRVSVLQLAADGEEPAHRLLAAARARGESLHYVNVPEGDPASVAFAGLGGTLELRQCEFLRTVALR
jgi:ribosomal protein S18 acetylase RimI-like enzyme